MFDSKFSRILIMFHGTTTAFHMHKKISHCTSQLSRIGSSSSTYATTDVVPSSRMNTLLDDINLLLDDETSIVPVINEEAFVENLKMHEEAIQKGEGSSEFVHSVVAKLFFIMKRARPDLEMNISFLMTRVSKSDEDDWRKLKG